MKNERLHDIVQVSSKKLGIKVEKVKCRRNWYQEKIAFISRVIEPMLKLRDFGFEESEIELFVQGVEDSLDSAIFFFLLKKNRKESKNFNEFKDKMISDWDSPKILDYLNDISDIILDDFFIRKGGIIFLKES